MIFPGQTGIICWKALSRAIIPEKMSNFYRLVQKLLYMALTQIDAFFAFFGHIEWTIAEKLPVWWKWCFGYRKRYLRTIYPENLSHRASVVHEICLPRFLYLLNDPKWNLVIISGLEYQIDLILHMMEVLDDTHDLAIHPCVTGIINYA